MSPLWTALWTVVALLGDAFQIAAQEGLAYLFKFLLASFRLAYKHSKRGRVFKLFDLSKDADPVHNGAVSAPHEWTKECPSPSESLAKKEDIIFIYGVNSAGYKLALYFSRLKNCVAELWLCLYTPNGDSYVLPCDFTLDHSDERSFAGRGLKVQCLAPARRWRIAFNGSLRKRTADSKDLEGPAVHVRLAIIWTPLSHTLEAPVELSPSLLAENFAKLPLIKMLWQIEQFGTDMDVYDQGGMMTGQVTIDGETTEVQLWGSKVRSKGSLSTAPGIEDHHFGFLEDGTVYHLVHTDSHAKPEGLFYGNMYLPLRNVWPIDYCLVRSNGLKHGKPLRLYMSAGSEDFPVQVSHEGRASIFTTEDSSRKIQVLPCSLVSTDKKGNGFTVRIEKKGPTTYRVPECYRHHVVGGDSGIKKPLVVNIRQQNCKRPELTGGKGSSLAVLHSISEQFRTFTVPEAFVITTEAYDIFASGPKFQRLLKEVLLSQTSGDGLPKLKETCKSVVQAMGKLPLPEVLKEEVERHLQKFGGGYEKKTFAVRSSAVGEDSEEMSAAGQMQTFLGVRGTKKVFESIVRCWASQFSFTAVNYKRQYGQVLNTPMAVVIQEMVPASVSGVMFTCDPVKGDPSFITVAANYGLGESVVSASAESDTFLLKRTDGLRPTLHSVQLGQKTVFLTESETEGVLMQPVPESKTKQKCMTDEQIEQIAHIGTQVERCYAAPRDIEWAIGDDKYYLLQCRPVSSIMKETDYELIHELDTALKSEKELLTKANVSEVFPGAITPLGFCIMRLCFDTYSRETGCKLMPEEQDVSNYTPIWLPMRAYSLFLWLSQGQREVDAAGDVVARATLYSTVGKDISNDPAAKESVKRKSVVDYRKLLMSAIYIAKLLLRLQKHLEETTQLSLDVNLSIDGLSTAQQMYRMIGSNLRFLAKPSVLLVEAFSSSSLYNLAILRTLVAAEGDTTPEVFLNFSKMLRGCDAESTDVPNSIKKLGNLLRQSEDRDRFLSMSVAEATEWLKTTESECGAKFREFLERHGHRNVKEFDVYTKPWGMDPSSLILSLKAAAKAPSNNDTTETEGWTLEKLPYNLTSFQRLLLKFLVPRARVAVARRETAKSACIRMVHKLRLAFIQLSNQMVREGRIPEPDLLFFMTFEEIGDVLRTRSPTVVFKARRRFKLHSELNKVKFPFLVAGIPQPVRVLETKPVEGEFELQGSPMSQGLARGPARVVQDFEEAHLIRRGEILITTATDTGWTPYFPLLAGVVTEIGGPLSHGAVVAREYGLPCVVGVEGATSMLSNGDQVLLDGNRGILKKILHHDDDDEDEA